LTQYLFVSDACSQPAKEEGTCYDYVLRYSYVSSSGQCEPFYYGGCEGNDNRFESPEECQAQCIRSEAATTRRPPRETERPDSSNGHGLLFTKMIFTHNVSYFFVLLSFFLVKPMVVHGLRYRKVRIW